MYTTCAHAAVMGEDRHCVKCVDGLQFRIMSAERLHAMSVVDVTNPSLYKKGVPWMNDARRSPRRTTKKRPTGCTKPSPKRSTAIPTSW